MENNDQAKESLRIAIELIDSNQLYEAEIYLTKAIKNYPDFLLFYYFRSMVFLDLNEYEKSISDLNNIINNLSEDVDEIKLENMYYFRGQANFKLGKLNEAFADISHSITMNPEEPEYYYVRANIFKDSEPPAVIFYAAIDIHKCIRNLSINHIHWSDYIASEKDILEIFAEYINIGNREGLKDKYDAILANKDVYKSACELIDQKELRKANKFLDKCLAIDELDIKSFVKKVEITPIGNKNWVNYIISLSNHLKSTVFVTESEYFINYEIKFRYDNSSAFKVMVDDYLRDFIFYTLNSLPKEKSLEKPKIKFEDYFQDYLKTHPMLSTVKKYNIYLTAEFSPFFLEKANYLYRYFEKTDDFYFAVDNNR